RPPPIRLDVHRRRAESIPIPVGRPQLCNDPSFDLTRSITNFLPIFTGSVTFRFPPDSVWGYTRRARPCPPRLIHYPDAAHAHPGGWLGRSRGRRPARIPGPGFHAGTIRLCGGATARHRCSPPLLDRRVTWSDSVFAAGRRSR